MAPAPLTCPAAADLEQPAQFDAMLRARASSTGDIVITILGPTSGARAIQMGKLGWLMLANMLANLGRVGVTNHLAITTHLHLPAHADNNLCLSELRPRGVCCAWAGVGMRLVAEGTVGRTWTISETHPYLLFLQRWWFTSQATARGYNVLSLDTDMHLDTNPLAMMRGPAWSGFGAMLQLDSGWPSEARREGQRSTDDRGQHENLVPCQPGRSSSPSPASFSAAGEAVTLTRTLTRTRTRTRTRTLTLTLILTLTLTLLPFTLTKARLGKEVAGQFKNLLGWQGIKKARDPE